MNKVNFIKELKFILNSLTRDKGFKQEETKEFEDSQEITSLKCYDYIDAKDKKESNEEKLHRYSLSAKVSSEVCNVIVYIHDSPMIANSPENRLRFIEAILGVNQKVLGSFALRKNALVFKSSIIYSAIPESMFSAFLYDFFDYLMSTIRKYKKSFYKLLESSKFPFAREIDVKNYVLIDEDIAKIIRKDRSLDDHLDVANIVEYNKGLYYYCENSNAIEELLYIYHNPSNKFFFTSYNEKQTLETKNVLRFYKKSTIKVQEKLNLRFDRMPIEPSTENTEWNKKQTLYNRYPYKIGYYNLKEYIKGKNVEEDVKMNTDGIENDFYSSITKSLKNWESNLKYHSKLDVNYFKFQDFTDEQLKFGKGGFGEVFKNVYCGSKVAIKFELPTRKSLNSKLVFFKEYYMTRRVNHKNILKVIGWIEYKDRLGIVMKFYKFGSLAQYLKDSDTTVDINDHQNEKIKKFMKKNGEFDIKKKLQIGIQLGYTFSALKHKKLIHFDIKPHNIYMGRGYSPIIADFGLAKIKESKKDIIKVNGCSVFYCPPEQIINSNSGFSADIWAFGCVLYFMFQSRHPFYYVKLEQKKNIKDKYIYLDYIHNHLKRPIFKQEFEEQYPDICEVIRNCWNIESSKRIKAEEIVEALSDILDELNI